MTPYGRARQRLGLKKNGLAAELGIGERSARNYESGKAEVPRVVGLALTALIFNLPPWDETEKELRQMKDG